MIYPISPGFSQCILVLTIILISPTQTVQAVAAADVGTVTQQITTFSAFPSQKACAQSCFIETGFCHNDILGSRIGCVEHTDCYAGLWLATNSCYCRTDLQAVAQSALTACVKRVCNVGDVMIDASSAGSIYSQYCVDNGFPAVAPVMVLATTTTTMGKGASATTGSVAEPTDPSTSQNESSSSGKLSTSVIIAVAIGASVGLTLLVAALQRAFRCGPGFRRTHSQPPPSIAPEPFYPPKSHPEAFYSQPGPRSEVSPEDSISRVGGMPGAAPTLLSAPPGYPQGYSQGYSQDYRQRY